MINILLPKPPAERIPLPRCIDTYTMIEPLGEGVDGYVRLAHPTSSPTTRVVLEYIFKSRILPICWIHELQNSHLAPIEFHNLHHLRSHTHPLIVRMIEYFEVNAYRYIVMEMGGSMTLLPIKPALDFYVNGTHIVKKTSDPHETLLSCLRRLGYPGTKLGCGEGGCGSCTVVVEEWDYEKGVVA